MNNIQSQPEPCFDTLLKHRCFERLFNKVEKLLDEHHSIALKVEEEHEHSLLNRTYLEKIKYCISQLTDAPKCVQAACKLFFNTQSLEEFINFWDKIEL